MTIKTRVKKLEEKVNPKSSTTIEVGLVEADGKSVLVNGKYISWMEWEKRCKNADRVIHIPPQEQP